MFPHQKQFHDLYNKDLVGLKVIVRDNESGPAKVGELVGWYDVHSKQIPMVKFADDGLEYICPSLVMPYHEGLLQLLNSMGPKESWDFFVTYGLLNSEVHRRMR